MSLPSPPGDDAVRTGMARGDRSAGNAVRVTVPPGGGPGAAAVPVPGAGVEVPREEVRPVSLGREALRRFMANRLAMLSLGVLIVLILLALCANFLPLIDPTVGDPFNQDGFPRPCNLLATAAWGHDMLRPTIFGFARAPPAGTFERSWRRRAPWAPHAGGSSRATSCPTPGAWCWCRRRSAWAALSIR